MSYAFRKNLFVTTDGASMVFNVSQCNEREEIIEYIEWGGGFLEKGEGPFTIFLQDEDGCSTSEILFDTYRPSFILESCMKDEIQPLKKYRYNAVSHYSDDFDPRDVLFRILTWREVKGKFSISVHGTAKTILEIHSKHNKKPDQGASNVHNPDEDESLDVETSTRCVIQKPNHIARSRNKFSEEERQAIVEFLVKAKAFDGISGTAVWKRMSLKINNHTWQSLKEHFLKKVMPLIETYGLSPEVVSKLRESVQPDQACGRGKGSRKSAFNRYSKEEDDGILKYVAKYGRNKPLSGNRFWCDMYEKHVIPGRPWKSLRERYIKYLRNQIRSRSTSPESLNETRIQNTSPSNSIEDCDSSCNETDPTCSRLNVENQSYSLKPSRKYRKLYSQTATFETAESDVVPNTPVSVKRKGPSMLEILVKKKDHRIKKNLNNIYPPYLKTSNKGVLTSNIFHGSANNSENLKLCRESPSAKSLLSTDDQIPECLDLTNSSSQETSAKSLLSTDDQIPECPDLTNSSSQEKILEKPSEEDSSDLLLKNRKCNQAKQIQDLASSIHRRTVSPLYKNKSTQANVLKVDVSVQTDPLEISYHDLS